MAACCCLHLQYEQDVITYNEKNQSCPSDLNDFNTTFKESFLFFKIKVSKMIIHF